MGESGIIKKDHLKLFGKKRLYRKGDIYAKFQRWVGVCQAKKVAMESEAEKTAHTKAER